MLQQLQGTKTIKTINIHFMEMLMDLYKCVFYGTDFDVDPSYELVDVGTLICDKAKRF